MARGDLLKRLFLTYLQRNDDAFRSVAMEIIAEEQKKNHTLLAGELQRILSNSAMNNSTVEPRYDLSSLPKDRERHALLVEIRKAERYFPDIILSKENQKTIEEIMEEFRRGEILRSHGINRRTKLLFCGPPGCGKTLLGEVIAAELGLPILYTRFDTIVSSYLGETSANLRKVFDYATRGTWVIFFDEFDAIGKSRDDLTEHGELKRVINSFLQLLDGFRSESLVIAATNHEHLLDTALWRRFDEILRLERPSVQDIRILLTKKLASIPHPQIKPEAIASSLKGLSHAEVERVCYDAIRLCVLRDSSEVTPELFEESMEREKQRLKIIRTADKRIKNSVKASK
ncbi:MAG: ATP-binding protein [Desulfobacterales bacterium]|nr:ATP-binding protein [Desulfobacterales bacterium]